MAMVNVRCTNCGATLQDERTKDASICPYCQKPYAVAQAINYYKTNMGVPNMGAPVQYQQPVEEKEAFGGFPLLGMVALIFAILAVLMLPLFRVLWMFSYLAAIGGLVLSIASFFMHKKKGLAIAACVISTPLVAIGTLVFIAFLH